ncbi:membrane-associated phospholipid phosphatase [Cenarchaeum symbiosum A]|uniref:Membrane-associated phospholipid phosphatase n=1 Tax=Cenarchaeum symbiosum (strain A) TaxID=414004 RepID=A0RXE8_CENSY|nr:membrane-associated phospholipid phosphatase [Cenarchaeum symbiosum A]
MLLVAAFLAVSLLVFVGATEGIDLAASGFAHESSGNIVLDLFMSSVTEVGDVFYMLVFTIVLIIIRRTRRIGIALLILLVLSTLVTGYVKCGVNRERPDLEFAGSPFIIDLSPDTFSLFCDGGFNASYPSGHVSRAMVFAVVLGFALSERFPRGCYFLLLYPALMGLSRVYLVEHFPADVVGGALLGALLAGAVGGKTGLRSVLRSKS